MNHSRTAIASGLLAIALIAPAHADLIETSASASITNVSIQLKASSPFDKNPPWVVWASPDTGEGSTPFTFSIDTSTTSVDASGKTSTTHDVKVAPSVGANIFTPTSATQSSETISTQGSITSKAISSQMHLALDPSDPAHDQKTSAWVGVRPSQGVFVLSPFTRITITGNYATSVAGTGGESLAAALGRLWLESAPDKISEVYAKSDFFPRVWNPRTGEPMDSDPTPKSGTFTLTLSNNTANATRGGLSLSVWTHASLGTVSSVPEPETIALMLAGLGVVASTRWRKRH